MKIAAREGSRYKIAVVVASTMMAIFLCLGVGLVMADDMGGDGEAGAGAEVGLGEGVDGETVGKTVYLRPDPDIGYAGLEVTFLGSGTEADPYQVSSPEHLDAIRVLMAGGSGPGGNIPAEPAARYIQTADIDLGPYIATYYGGGEGLGWLPLGKSEGEENLTVQGIDFKGVYDGQGYQIRNLRISRPGMSDVGLFSRLSKASFNPTLKNIIIVDAQVIGGASGASNAINVGGLLGYLPTDGRIENSAIKGNSLVKSYGHRVGGLVGAANGRIYNSYSLAQIDGKDIEYKSGDKFVARAGGLVGYLGGNSSSIHYSYAAGLVDVKASAEHRGGLLGENARTVGQAIYASYYDSQVSGRTGDTKGIAKTTAEMKDSDTYLLVDVETDIWDFDDVWLIDTEGEMDIESGEVVYKNQGYPYLQVEKEYELAAEDPEEAEGPEAPGDGGEGDDTPAACEGDDCDEGEGGDEPPPVNPPAPVDNNNDDYYYDDYDDWEIISQSPEPEEEILNLDDLQASLLEGLEEISLLALPLPEDERMTDEDFQPASAYGAMLSTDRSEGDRIIHLPTIFVWDGQSWQGLALLLGLEEQAGNQEGNQEVASLTATSIDKGFIHDQTRFTHLLAPLYEYDFLDADLLTGAMDYMASRQIIRGYEASDYNLEGLNTSAESILDGDSYLLKADQTASRAEFLVLMMRSLGLDIFMVQEFSPATDASNLFAAWYEEYVSLADQLGLIDGGSMMNSGARGLDWSGEDWNQAISLAEAELMFENLESLSFYRDYRSLRVRLDELGLVYQLGLGAMDMSGDFVDEYLTRAKAVDLIYKNLYQ